MSNTTILRRINDKVMAELTTKVDGIEKSQKETQSSLITLNATVNFVNSTVSRMDRALFGEVDERTKERISEGMKPQHDEMYADYNFNKRIKTLLYAVLGTNVLYLIIPIVKWIISVIEVRAGN